MKALVSVATFLVAAILSQPASAQGLVADGQKYFNEAQCATCHSLTSQKAPSHTGPALYGTTKKPGRTKEWLTSWISDPETMLKTDKLAQQLLKENNNIPMTGMLKLFNKKADGTPDMDAVKKKAAAIVEFLKDNDSKPEGGAGGPKKKKG